MKKYIFMAVAGMLALSSCSSDDNNEQTAQNAPQKMTFTAGFGDGAQTRTSITYTYDDDAKKYKGKVSFDADDEISILSAKNSNANFVTDDGGATATFTGEAVPDTKFYAIYPYSGFVKLSGDVIENVWIPSEQTLFEEDAWDTTAPIAWATTTDGHLQFHNACALLKIHNDMGDDAIIDIACDNRVLTGFFKLDTTTGTLTVQQGPEFDIFNQYSVSTENVPNNKTIYIAIAPGPVTELNAIVSKDEKQLRSRFKSGEVTFEAGKIYDLGKTSEWPEPEPES